MAQTRRIAASLLHTTDTLASIAAAQKCSPATVRRIAAAVPLHHSRRPVKRNTSRETVLAVADRLRHTRSTLPEIADEFGLAHDTVFRICQGRSRASITGGPIPRPGPPDDSYNRGDWLSDLEDAVRSVAAGWASPATVATVLLSIDEVHLPPAAARLMAMSVAGWCAAVRVDMAEGGTHRRAPLTPAQVARALEIARNILATGGRVSECKMPEIDEIALSRPDVGH